MQKNKVSVIIPVHNADKFLNRCVDSVLNQSYKNIEIILVDDGSTDNSGNLCDTYALIDNRIKVIHKINGGVSSARNIGLDNADGEYISFIDADDYISENMIECLYNIAKDGYDLPACSVYNDSGKDTYRLTQQYSEISDNPMYKIMSGIGEWIFNKLYRSDIIGSLRFDTELSFGEDVYWLSQYCLKCKNVKYSNSASYYYYNNSSSVCRNLDTCEKLINKYNMERKSHLQILKVYQKSNRQALIEFVHFMVSINLQNYIKIVKNKCSNASIENQIKLLCRDNFKYFVQSNSSNKMKFLCCVCMIFPKIFKVLFK